MSKNPITAVVVISIFMCLGNNMHMFVMPLWVSDDLGMSAGEFASISSLRWLATLIALLPFGLLCERIGTRLGGSASLLGAGILLLALPSAGIQGLPWLYPCLGACISASYVSAQALVQNVSEARRPLSNSIYRAIGAAAGIAAPSCALLTKSFTDQSWDPALSTCGAAFCLAALAFFLSGVDQGFQAKKAKDIFRSFFAVLGNRRLRSYVIMEQSAMIGLAPAGVFQAIYITQVLQASDSLWTISSTTAAISGLCITISSAFLVRRIGLGIGACIAWWAGAFSCLSITLIGNLHLALFFWVCGASFAVLHWVLFPMWLTKMHKANPATFSLHKMVTAGVNAISLAILGWLEAFTGMAILMQIGACVSIAAGTAMLFLQHSLLHTEVDDNQASS